MYDLALLAVAPMVVVSVAGTKEDLTTPTTVMINVTGPAGNRCTLPARRQLANARGLPLSLRLLDEVHARLMRGTRGAGKQPGEVRRTQNWLGGTRPGNAAFVPPPPHELRACLAALEAYIHAEDDLPPLIRAALLHVQFETIHPYLDGNGRVGRLLITLLLEHWKVLRRPLLYLSLHFKRHRSEYYDRLTAVRTQGDWEGWIDFFLEGVTAIANEGVQSARDLFSLVSSDRTKVLSTDGASLYAARLFELLPTHPIVNISAAIKLLSTTKPTATKAIATLVDAGVLVETTGRQRDRLFAYGRYLEKLRAGAN